MKAWVPCRLYRPVAGYVPLEHRYVLIRFSDGATWLTPGRESVELEARYMHSNAELIADRESDHEERRRILSRTLREWRWWCEVNCDAEQAVLEARWDDLRKAHIGGPRTEVPGNDRVWLVHENGGDVLEVVDMPPHGQRRVSRYWFDRRPGHEADGKGLCAESKPVWRRMARKRGAK